MGWLWDNTPFKLVKNDPVNRNPFKPNRRFTQDAPLPLRNGVRQLVILGYLSIPAIICGVGWYYTGTHRNEEKMARINAAGRYNPDRLKEIEQTARLTDEYIHREAGPSGNRPLPSSLGKSLGQHRNPIQMPVMATPTGIRPEQKGNDNTKHE